MLWEKSKRILKYLSEQMGRITEICNLKRKMIKRKDQKKSESNGGSTEKYQDIAHDRWI